MSQSFVILFHVHVESKNNHLDLLVELQPGGALASWRLMAAPEALEQVPSEHEPEGLPAEQQPDHRREFLTYEGPVSGGRGDVRRVDHGCVTLVDRSPGHVTFTLAGQRLRGTFTLRHVEGGRWELRRATTV